MGRLINNRFGLRHMGSVGASPQTPYMDAANGAVNGAGRKLETLGGNKSGPRSGWPQPPEDHAASVMV